MRTRPLNNNVLVKLTREFEGVSRDTTNEDQNVGVLVDYSVNTFHLTASAGVALDRDFGQAMLDNLKIMLGHTVRWEQYAEGGQTFEEDGATYALVPWWRLISVTKKEQ